jgi:hypothetical protein
LGAVEEMLLGSHSEDVFETYAILSAKLARAEPWERQVTRIFYLLRNPLSAPWALVDDTDKTNRTKKASGAAGTGAGGADKI